jgi:hypothetical protein
MVLSKVTYRLFDYERLPTGGADPYYLDGEVVLEMVDGKRLFFSWGNKPKQHSVEVRDCSFFNDVALVNIDVTDQPCWRPLVGQPSLHQFVDSDHQVLRVNDAVFLASRCSDGYFYGDCICVSTKNPL